MLIDITLNFDFSINDEKCKNILKTQIEQKENIIAFYIKHDLNLFISGSRLISCTQDFHNNYIYTFEFDDLEKTTSFLEDPQIDVISYKNQLKDLEKEANDFMINYDRNEENKKVVKKIKMDDEGFQYEY